MNASCVVKARLETPTLGSYLPKSPSIPLSAKGDASCRPASSRFPAGLRECGILGLCCILLFALAASAGADEGLVSPQNMPGPLQQVSFEQHLGETLPLDTPFVDEAGTPVVLGEYFGERPVILTFVYYDCPMLCTLILNGLAKSLGVLSFDAGTDFDVVAISIDPSETPQQAREIAATTLARYDRPDTAHGWHFLTGSAAAVEKVTEAAGFNYAPIAETGEFAHASGIVIASPQGKLSQYYLGVNYPARDVRLALVEAASNNIGSIVDQLLLYCFRYDPNLGKYTAVTLRIVRVTGALFVVALFAFLMVLQRNEKSMRSIGKLQERPER